MPQGAARKRHTAVAIIGGRAHPQVLDAQAAQQPLRHPKRHASLGHMHSPIRLVLKQTLKLGHEVLVPACSCATFARRASGQAFHEGVDQLLLKPARGSCMTPVGGGPLRTCNLPDFYPLLHRLSIPSAGYLSSRRRLRLRLTDRRWHELDHHLIEN
jgi:hypothetical protein